jgi:hypothetical protein
MSEISQVYPLKRKPVRCPSSELTTRNPQQVAAAL